MAYKVMNIRKINYLGMTKEEREKIWRIDDLCLQQMTTSFDDGDYYALYEDVDRKADDPDDRKYAVYLYNSGKLLCLLPDCAVALNGQKDADYGDARSELYRQIAIAAGWPKTLPKRRYTVHIVRAFDVEVHVNDFGQAWKVGKKVAEYANGEFTGGDLNYKIKSAANDTEYELADAWDAEDEDSDVWFLRLDMDECKQLLKED